MLSIFGVSEVLSVPKHLSALNESINKNKILGFIIQSFQSELKRFSI